MHVLSATTCGQAMMRIQCCFVPWDRGFPKKTGKSPKFMLVWLIQLWPSVSYRKSALLSQVYSKKIAPELMNTLQFSSAIDGNCWYSQWKKYDHGPVLHGVQRRIRPRSSALSPWPLEAEVFAHQLSQRDGETHGKTMGKPWENGGLVVI